MRFSLSLSLLLALAAVGWADPYEDLIVSQGPLAYYRLNETSGTTATATVGPDATYGNGGTFAGSLGNAGPTPAQFPGFDAGNLAPDFDQTANNLTNRIDLPAGSLNLESDVGSVSFWFNGTMADLDSNSSASILFWGGSNNGDGFGGQNEMHVHIRPGDSGLNAFINGGVNGGTSGGGFLDGDWHHVAFTWQEDDSGDNAARLFVDGVEEFNQTHNANSFDLNNLLMARPLSTNSNGNGREFGGLLDEVAIFNRVLSPDEVRAQFDAGTTIVPEPTSIAIWSLIGLGLAGFGCYRLRRKK